MFNLDPFSRGVASTEILILLAIAALVGYLLARLLTTNRISELRLALSEQSAALDDCLRKRKASASVLVPTPTVQKTVEFTTKTLVSTDKSTATAEIDEETMFRKIASRASELNFNRIGHATLNDADDLKEIVGVGPFFERKLHTLGIFNFRQLANFTTEDMEKVSDIIEFFPDRIEREDWVGQAKQLYKDKYGRSV